MHEYMIQIIEDQGQRGYLVELVDNEDLSSPACVTGGWKRAGLDSFDEPRYQGRVHGDNAKMIEEALHYHDMPAKDAILGISVSQTGSITEVWL